MNALQSQETEGEVRDAVKNLAKGENKLDQAHYRTMERVQSQAESPKRLAIRSLAWIFYTKRPLSVAELRHALAIRPTELTLDKSYLPNVKRLLAVCAGLVRLDEKSKAIDFIHKTTRDYFETTKETWFTDLESDIAIACVTYLSFDVFKSGICQTDREFEERLRTNRFFEYAAHNWGYHAQATSNSCHKVIEFLQKQAQVEASIQALMAVMPWLDGVEYSQKIPKQMTGLHLAAYFGVSDAAQFLIGNNNPDLKNSYSETPLLWAAANGHEDVVQLLLATGQVDPDSKDKCSRTPLWKAANNGHADVVQLLLATGRVDVDLKDAVYGRTSLSQAAERGHEAVVQLFLATGLADAESKDRFNQTPLWLAIENGHEDIVQLLLATGQVDVNSKYILFGQTLISWAFERGNEAIILLLLATGQIDFELKDISGRTLLSWAALKGNTEVVKLLLATGQVDIESKDKRGRTPLLWAALKGNAEVVKELLATDQVGIDSKDNSGRTPLSWAALNRNAEVVKLLLTTGQVDVYLEDTMYDRTPLSWAALNGNTEVVKLLLATGQVDIELKDKRGQTPLLWATLYGNTRSCQAATRYRPSRYRVER